MIHGIHGKTRQKFVFSIGNALVTYHFDGKNVQQAL